MGVFSGGKRQNNQDSAIVDVALHNPDKAKRGEAIKQLVDEDLLFKIAMNDEDEWIRFTAAMQLTDQKRIIEVILKGPEGRAKHRTLDKLTKYKYLQDLVTKSDNIEARWYAMRRLDWYEMSRKGKVESPNFGFGVCSFYNKELLKSLGLNKHLRCRPILASGKPTAIRAIAADDSLYKEEDIEARMVAVANLRSQEDLLSVVDAIVDVCRRETERVLWALMCAIDDHTKLTELLSKHPHSYGSYRLHEWLWFESQYGLDIAAKHVVQPEISPVDKPPRKEAAQADFCDATGLFEDFNFKLLVVEDLLDKSSSFGRDLEKLRDETLPFFDYYFDGPIAEIVSFLSKLELSQEDLDKVTSLCFDGGNKIYEFIQPDWDGEDELFDVHSVKGFELLKNLQSVWFGGGLCEDAVLYPIRDAGIPIEGRELTLL